MELLCRIAIPMLKDFIEGYMPLLQKSYKHWVFARLIENTALAQFSAISISVPTAMFVGLSSPHLSVTDETWQFLSLSRLSKADIIKGFSLAVVFTQQELDIGWERSLHSNAADFVARLKVEGKPTFTVLKVQMLREHQRGAALAESSH